MEKISDRLSVIWKSACSGTHVIGLAGDDFAFVVLQKAAGLGDAEVGQFHVAGEGDHDVFEADIAMDDAEGFAGVIGLGMGVSQAAGDAAGDEDGQFRGQHAVFLRQLLGELFQVHAVDQFHADEVKPARLAQMIGLDDVGVDQVGHQLGLADEILDELLLVGVILADDFHGHAFDEVARAVLLGLVNDAHAALENLADDFVAELVLYGKQPCHAEMLVNCRVKSSLRWRKSSEKCGKICARARFSPCAACLKGFNSAQ